MARFKYQLTSIDNFKLSKDGIVAIPQPPVLTCPGAGDCLKYCYACVGQQAMGNPKEFRLRAYRLYLDTPKEYERIAKEEIHRSGRRIVRWHDSGDIQSLQYLKMMVRIAKHFPEVRFYTYSKSIPILIKFGFKNLPKNLKIIQSYGGKYDHLINKRYPYAKVFKTKKEIPKDFINCSDSDYRAATDARKIAIIAHGARKSKFEGGPPLVE